MIPLKECIEKVFEGASQMNPWKTFRENFRNLCKAF